ncbi:MAG: ATP-binding protein, partial [Pseudomonadota bacterium]
ELRTPMNGIMGMLELALRSDLTPSQTQQLETARKSANILLHLLNDILDVSKLEEGKLDLECIPFKPVELLHETRQFLNLSAQEKGLNLQTHLSEEVPDWVLGDPTRTRQILINLIGNAIKFSDHGVIDVRVGYDPDSKKLSIEVEDHGTGISPENLPKLFKRFAQGDASTTRRYGGTGLGLAICRELVEQMGGSIDAKSTLGEGSTFFFTINAPKCDTCSDDTSSVQKSKDTEATRAINILIAEDNPINQMVIEAFVRKAGHKCLLVSDGQEALNALNEGDFDAILMDVQMPNMDGLEATSHIRSRTDAKKDIPIIALTANAMSGDRDTYLNAGMTDYLSKPVDSSALCEALTKIADRPVPASPLTKSA